MISGWFAGKMAKPDTVVIPAALAAAVPAVETPKAPEEPKQEDKAGDTDAKE